MKPPTLQVKTWTPSRYAKWKECPAKVKYQDLMKLCPVCYKGRVSGGYGGEPVQCDTCSKPQPSRPPLERGDRLDAALTNDLAGSVPTPKGQEPGEHEERAMAVALEAHRESLEEATHHPYVEALVKKLRKSRGVSTQESIVMDSTWKRVGQFTKDAWARLKLDVLWLTPKIARVIDWKSGNIKGNEIREKDEYHDSMRMYQAAVLSNYPQAECSAEMVFLDAPSKIALPVKSLPVLKRKDLADARELIERKLSPMFADKIFPPKPGYYCDWCDFSKRRGGPCQF